MKRRAKAFTMIELLVVLAIIILAAGVLAPVFFSARAAAQKTICASHLHQASLAMSLYVADYDDHYSPVNYEPGQSEPDPTNDRTWVQLLLPYARSFDIFHDPGDTGTRPTIPGYFDEDLVASDTYARYYLASLRSDIGFNYIYLSPVIETNVASNTWTSEPLQTVQVTDPSRTLMFIDSLWERNSSGDPSGGGSWLVVPPCRYDAGTMADSFEVSQQEEIFAVSNGWSGNTASSAVYGRAWPWHSGNFNVAMVDGSIKSVTPGGLTEGCNAQPQWSGYIVNPSAYIWSAR